jgi:Gram-negative bacterial TonB protein C-terminal
MIGIASSERAKRSFVSNELLQQPPKNMRPSKLNVVAVLAGLSLCAARLPAENLPQIRPALIGSGPGSLVNSIDTQALFQKGQRDAWVMFECAVAGDGIAFGSDFFTASPNSDLLKNEVRRRLRQTRFIPAVYNHKRTYAWFAGTVVFIVANGKPHLRIYANQDLDEIKRGTDFVAPQLIDVPNHYLSNLPHFPSKATHDEAAGVVKLRHSVDAHGKTTDLQVISEPPGYQLGDYLKKVLPLLDYSPGYRNGKPTATTYTLTWWFGRTVGW